MLYFAVAHAILFSSSDQVFKCESLSGACAGLSDKGCSVADAGDGSVGQEFCSAYPEDAVAPCCVDCAELSRFCSA